MTKVKNKTNKRITFPVLSFSIGPNETKEIDKYLVDKVLSCQDIVKVEITKNEVDRRHVRKYKTRKYNNL